MKKTTIKTVSQKKIAKITLTMTPDEASFLECALEKAMANEGDMKYYAQYQSLCARVSSKLAY
jgi:hypothetical protein